MRIPSKGRCDGDDRWPPGFRFHPTDEELVVYYLKRKMCRKRIKLDAIAETDVYKCDPEELPTFSALKTGDRQWFFFSPRDRKYPNGGRSNRATNHGYWKATGKDRNVTCCSRTVGLKKTLVFYRGRAPYGERTDWVMHEYTLDEEELKRCQNVKEYYALYKVYKKSGPGPKNGEQYGAPFKEEDWADDDVNDTADSAVPAKELIDVAPVDNERVNNQAGSQIDDIEELLRQIVDEPPLPQQQIDDFTDLFPQVVGEEETHSALVEPSFEDVTIPEPVNVLSPSVPQYDEHAIFDFTQSATSKPQVYQEPEVASVTNNSEWVHPDGEEDYVEMADFRASKDKPVENFLQFEDFEVLNELDLFHDANMFLQDNGHIDQGTMSHLYGMVNQVDYHLESDSHSVVTQADYQFQPNAVVTQADYQFQTNGVVTQADYQFQPNAVVAQAQYQFQPNAVVAEADYPFQPNPVVTQVDYHFQPHAVVTQVDYQFQPHAVGADQMSSQMWMHQQRNVVTPIASNQGVVSLPTSGVVYESTNLLTEVNQNQNKNDQEGAGTSWLSSALWSFVESIPTTPASASERPLVNRAFERMSSFSRVRLHARTNNVAADNGDSTVRRAGSNRGFLILSGLGALFAILWVLIGTVGVLGRCISS